MSTRLDLTRPSLVAVRGKETVKPTQTIIVASMTVAVVNATVASLSKSQTKGPPARIIIGGWVLTVGLLLGSEAQPGIAESIAVLVLFASLFGPNGTVLADALTKATTSTKAIAVKKGSGIAIGAGNAVQPYNGGNILSDSFAKLTGVPRAEALKLHQIKPELVTMANGFQLDKSAAASFPSVERQYGRSIALSNTYRSPGQQAAAYAKAGPTGTFAPPGTSLHEVGLAVDVDMNRMDVTDPRLVAAFLDNGWFRQAKKVMFNGRMQPEPWHYSYGVPG